MSLNWNATSCGDAWKALEPSKQESLIFATMFVDMGEITEKNHEDFFRRYVQFSNAVGQPQLYLTLEDVKAAIGLTTNVFTTTPAAYRKRLGKILEDKASDALYSAKRRAEAAAKAEQEAQDAQS